MHRPQPPLSGFVVLVVLVALALAISGTPAVALAAPGTPAPTVAPTAAPKGPTPAPTGTAKPPGTGATATPAPAGALPAYDPKQDKGCGDCGPNGRAETARDRVARWADDCRKAGRADCEADSVQRLYSEYQAQGKDWATSGYAAPPDMAGSTHNCPDYWAGQAKGCVADGSAVGTGGGGGGGADGGGGFGLPTPGSLARAVLGAIDWKALLTGLLKGLWEILVGDGIAQFGDQLAGFVLTTPNLLAEDGGMGNVQRLVDDLRAAAVGACLVAFTFTVIQFMAGREQEPGAALGRLLAVLLALGFYRPLVGWLLRGASALSSGIQHVGNDTTTGAFTTTLKLLLPVAAPLWYLLSLLGALLVIAIGVVKIVGLAFLLLTYVAGPLLLPLGIHPRTAGWVGVWAEHLVKALLWPVLWALEFRVFGAITGGLTLFDARGEFSPATGALGALTALALLGIMAGTPWGLHTQFTLRRGAQAVGRQVVRAADAAALVATGGAAVTVRGAVAHTLRARAGQGAAEAGDAGRRGGPGPAGGRAA
jgi:hypothetical protein